MGGWRGVGDNLTDGFLDWIISRLLVVDFSVFSVSFFFLTGCHRDEWVGSIISSASITQLWRGGCSPSQPLLSYLLTIKRCCLKRFLLSMQSRAQSIVRDQYTSYSLIMFVNPSLWPRQPSECLCRKCFHSDEMRIKGKPRMEENQGSIPGIK